MLSGHDIFASSSALEKDIDYPHGYGPVSTEKNHEILLVQIPHITFSALIYPKGGAWYS